MSNEEQDIDDESYVTDTHILLSALGDHPRTRILAVFIGHPHTWFTPAETAAHADLDPNTINIEQHLNELTEVNIIDVDDTSTPDQYAVNTDNDAAESLAQFEWNLVKNLAEREDTDLWKGIQDAKDDNFARPKQEFEFGSDKDLDEKEDADE